MHHSAHRCSGAALQQRRASCKHGLPQLRAGPRTVVRCRSAAGQQPSDKTTEELKRSAQNAARVAQVKFKQLAEWTQDNAQRTWRRLDSEHNLAFRAEKLGRRMEETARDVDQNYQVRRRVRNSIEYVQRHWPVWSAQLDSFSTTWYGKATILAVVLAVASTQAFWSLLNFLLLLWWLAIPIGAALINAAQRKAAEQAAAAQAQEQARQANPFADLFRPRQATAGSGGPAGRARSYSPPEGPIVDAEYVVLKDSDSSSSSSKDK